jgi:hypothetical protein
MMTIKKKHFGQMVKVNRDDNCFARSVVEIFELFLIFLESGLELPSSSG